MSQIRYERLLAAGAPKLPDGYFYRISQDRFGGRYDYRFDIRKRGWFGSDSVLPASGGIVYDLSSSIRDDPSQDPVELLAYALQKVYGKWRFNHYEADQKTRWDEWIGDHP